MSEQANVEHVQREYAAFLEDDLDAVLEMSAPDVEYRYPDVEELAYGGVWRGRDGVRRLFEVHDEVDQVLELRPTEMVAQGDKVVVLGTFRGRAVPTGREWTTDFVHVYTIRGGKTRRFESYFDTAAFLVAHGLLGRPAGAR
jgi:uncharacterized protein